MFKNPKNIMVSILFLIAVAAILYFAATKQVDKMLLTFGFTFLGVGVLWLCTNKPTWETAPFSIILLAGAGLILVSLDKMGASFLSALPDNWISIFFLAAAIMIGAILIISSIMDVKIKRKKMHLYGSGTMYRSRKRHTIICTSARTMKMPPIVQNGNIPITEKNIPIDPPTGTKYDPSRVI